MNVQRARLRVTIETSKREEVLVVDGEWRGQRFVAFEPPEAFRLKKKELGHGVYVTYETLDVSAPLAGFKMVRKKYDPLMVCPRPGDEVVLTFKNPLLTLGGVGGTAMSATDDFDYCDRRHRRDLTGKH